MFFFLTETFLEDIEARLPTHCFIYSTIENGCIHQQVRGVLMDGHNQFGIRQFRCNRCCSDFGFRDSSGRHGL